MERLIFDEIHPAEEYHDFKNGSEIGVTINLLTLLTPAGGVRQWKVGCHT